MNEYSIKEVVKMETFWEAFKRHGVDRRDFLRFAFTITGLMGLSPSMFPEVVKALETKPRVPVLWIHGLECTCCSESFIRSATPLASDVLLSMISLEYDDTLSAAAGEAVENHRKEIIKKYWGNYILAVEGNPPLGEDGMYCIIGGGTIFETSKGISGRSKVCNCLGLLC